MTGSIYCRVLRENQKPFMDNMRGLQAVKDSVVALQKESGELTASDQETVDLLSAYFNEAFTMETDDDMPNIQEYSGRQWNDLDVTFNKEKIEDKLVKLKVNKSPSWPRWNPPNDPTRMCGGVVGAIVSNL